MARQRPTASQAKQAAQTTLWADPAGLGLAPASLTAWPPKPPADPHWQALWQAFLEEPSGAALGAFVRQRLAQGACIYPPEPLRAFDLTPLAKTRVVVLGQDPYHGPGQAEGLAFSVAPGVPTPPSLRNLFVELQRDLGLPMPHGGSLVPWARQGVLLLNACLTVEAGQPASHAGQGWEAFTDAVLARCSQDPAPKVFVLWGAHAQKKAPLIDAQRHQLLQANHPSPLSARRGPQPFIGCGHFSAINRSLQAHQQPPINWAL